MTAFHIFPDGLAFGIQHIGENGSGIITAFPSQRSAFIFIGGPMNPCVKIIFVSLNKGRIDA